MISASIWKQRVSTHFTREPSRIENLYWIAASRTRLYWKCVRLLVKVVSHSNNVTITVWNDVGCHGRRIDFRESSKLFYRNNMKAFLALGTLLQSSQTLCYPWCQSSHTALDMAKKWWNGMIFKEHVIPVWNKKDCAFGCVKHTFATVLISRKTRYYNSGSTESTEEVPQNRSKLLLETNSGTLSEAHQYVVFFNNCYSI